MTNADRAIRKREPGGAPPTPSASASASISPSLRNRLKLRHLQLLEALGQEQSLHGAANRLHMTQPNATRLLAELEDMLGARLFERSAKGLSMTPYGAAMTVHARVLLSNVDQTEDAMRALRGGSAGLVRIGAMTSLAPRFLADALADTLATSDQVRFNIVEGAHDMLAERLRHGELDLVVGRPRADAELAGLRVRTLAREAFSVVAGAAHPLARRRRLALRDLAGAAWVLPPKAVYVRQGFDTLFSQACGCAPVQVVESVSLFTNLHLLRSGQLLGLMPTPMATDLQSFRLLRVLPVALEGVLGPIVLITREGGILTAAAERVIQALVRGAQAPGRPAQT